MIDKERVLSELLKILDTELAEAQAAANSARALATQDDLKSEGKYDTRAIEASYLAGAQQKRVDEIKIDIQMLEELDLTPSSTVQLGSLVLIEHKGVKRFYFITSTSGGTMLSVDNQTVLVISVFSPLGNEALSLGVGDSFEIETPKESRLYSILAVS
jgi:transcription elongation GreA/GreB family factor